MLVQVRSDDVSAVVKSGTRLVSGSSDLDGAWEMKSENLAKIEARLSLAVPLSRWTHINSSSPNARDQLREYGVEIGGPSRASSHDFFFRSTSPTPNAVSIHFDPSNDCTFIIEEP